MLALLVGLALVACGGSSREALPGPDPTPIPIPTSTAQPSPTEGPPAPTPSTGPSELDQSFGDGGIAIVRIGNTVRVARRGLFVSADGRISLLGLRDDGGASSDLLRIELSADGRDAVVSQPLPSFRGEAAAFAPDGSAIVLGEREDDEGEILAARLTPTGDIDTTFGDDGFAPTGLATRIYGGRPELLFLPDGRALAFNRDAVVRLTVDGELDRSFGEDGVAVAPTPLPPRSEEFYVLNDVGVAPDGRLIVSAEYHVSISVIPHLIALTSDGERDLFFGEMGVVSYYTLGANGRLLVKADGPVIWLVRGEVFFVSADGKVVTTVADRPLEVGVEVLAETAAGGVVAGGFSWIPDEPRRFDCEFPDGSDRCVRRAVAVQSIGSDGVLDTGFGDGGTGRTDLAPPYGALGTGASAIVAAPEGRLTVAGHACDLTHCDVAVLRYRAP